MMGLSFERGNGTMAKRMGNLYNRKDGVLGWVYSNGKRLIVTHSSGSCQPGFCYLGELYLQEHDEQWRVGFSPAYNATDAVYRQSRQINDLLWDYRDKLIGR